MLLSGAIRSRSAANIALLLLALINLLVLPGCWVNSINGLSEAKYLGSDKDQAFDPILSGAWTKTNTDEEDDCAITLNVTAEDKEYHWKVTGKGRDCSGNKDDYYEAELFKLGDHEFLDMTARATDVCSACIAVHWIFKVDAEKDSFTLSVIDSDWLDDAESNNVTDLGPARGDRDMLTASPKELKDFCRKYADDEDVFKPAFIFDRKQP